IVELQNENTELVSRLAGSQSNTNTASQSYTEESSAKIESSVHEVSTIITEKELEANATSANSHTALLQAQLSSATEALSSSTRQSTTLKQKVESLEAELLKSTTTSNTHIQELTTRISTMEKEISSSRTRAEDAETQVDIFLTTIRSMEQEIRSLEASLNATEAEADAVHARLDESQRCIATLEAQVKEWKDKCEEHETEAQRSLDMSREISDELKDRFVEQVLERDATIQRLEQSLHVVEMENQRLASRVDELTAAINSYETQRAQQVELVALLRVELEQKDVKIDSVQRDRNSCRAEVESLTLSNQNLMSSLAAVASESANLKNAVTVFTTRVSELEASLIESKESLQTVVSDFKKKLAAKENEVKELEETNTALESRLAATSQQQEHSISMSSRDISTVNAGSDDLRSENEALRVDLQHHQVANQQLQSDILQLQSKPDYMRRPKSSLGHRNSSLSLSNISISSETTTETLQLLDNAIGIMQPDGSFTQDANKSVSMSSSSKLTVDSPQNSPAQSVRSPGQASYLHPSHQSVTSQSSSATLAHHDASTPTNSTQQEEIESLKKQHFQKEMEWLAQLVSNQQQSITTISSLRLQLESQAQESANFKASLKEMGSEMLWKEQEFMQALEGKETDLRRVMEKVDGVRERMRKAILMLKEGVLEKDGVWCGNCEYLKDKVGKLEVLMEEERERSRKEYEELMGELYLLSA
ncbi:hypothetical protein HDU99_002476, partial [Rhizoclosmatium hyalinum]